MGKKNKKEAVQPEIVSLNEELFSLEPGSLTVEALDQRLELAVAAFGKWVCDTFTCGTFTGTCKAFGCGTFNIRT